MAEGQYGELARWYDPLYATTGKDHGAEATAVLEVVRERGTVVNSLLDVACGTGQHLAAFAAEVSDCAGIDSAPAMLEVARERLPDNVPLRHGDMRRFDLGRSFDVVTCLFSAIGHVRDEGDLDAAVAAMARHVAPGGLLVIEPWLTPETVRGDGVRSLDTVETEDGVCARASRSTLRGDVLVVEFAWAVATEERVTTHKESFRMPLFTEERYLDAVRTAGLEPEWTQHDAMRTKRGLVLGRRSREVA